MKRAAILTLLLLTICLTVARAAECPTTATCAEHGMPGNPTGAYKWQGATEYAQFSHPLATGGQHVWWERCSN